MKFKVGDEVFLNKNIHEHTYMFHDRIYRVINTRVLPGLILYDTVANIVVPYHRAPDCFHLAEGPW